MYDDIDDETLERAATEALTQPSDSAMWDDRLYVTHGPVIGWADRGDDILEESNYLTVLAELQGIAAHADREDDVIDGSVSHWLVGSMRQCFVRVRDEDGAFTEVFKAATSIMLSLRDDYPVFDESDFSEREWKVYESQLEEAVTSAARMHDDDADTESVIRQSVYESERIGDTYVGSGECDWDLAEELYREARDAHFTELALDVVHAQIEGQMTLT